MKLTQEDARRLADEISQVRRLAADVAGMVRKPVKVTKLRWLTPKRRVVWDDRHNIEGISR